MPDKFNHGLRCSTEDVGINEFFRTIEAGNSSFRERVLLYPEQKIHTSTVGDLQQIRAESTTCIEEPEPDSLFVRFSYKRELDVRDDAVDVGEHLKAAYVQLDRRETDNFPKGTVHGDVSSVIVFGGKYIQPSQ